MKGMQRQQGSTNRQQLREGFIDGRLMPSTALSMLCALKPIAIEKDGTELSGVLLRKRGAPQNLPTSNLSFHSGTLLDGTL